jgi:hypothetical protein
MKVRTMEITWRRRLGFVLASPFETWLGLAVIITSLAFFLNPVVAEQTSVGRTLKGPLDEIWNALYGISGVFVLYGLIKPRLHAELFGLILMISGILVNIVGIYSVRGITTSLPSLTLLVAICLALAARSWSIYHYGQIDPVKSRMNIEVEDNQP